MYFDYDTSVYISLLKYSETLPVKAAFSTRSVFWKIPWLARHISFLPPFPRRSKHNFRSVARPRPPSTRLVSTGNILWNVPWVARPTNSFFISFPNDPKFIRLVSGQLPLQGHQKRLLDEERSLESSLARSSASASMAALASKYRTENFPTPGTTCQRRRWRKEEGQRSEQAAQFSLVAGKGTVAYILFCHPRLSCVTAVVGGHL